MPAFGQGEGADAQQYIVYAVHNESQRMEIAGTGAVIDAVGSDWVEFRATPEQVSAIEALGYRVEPIYFESEATTYKVYLPLLMAYGRDEEVSLIQQYVVHGVYDKFQRTENR
jgi:hypothetical protein